MILEAPVENYFEIIELLVIWILNASFLTLLVIALFKAGDSKTIYGKCLIRHAISMMMANVGIFLCTQLYLLGAFLPSWFCYFLGMLQLIKYFIFQVVNINATTKIGLMTYYFEMSLLFWLTCLLHGICVTFK